MAEVEPLPATDEPELSDGSLWQYVPGLPPKQRQAVSLRYVADLSHREIAVVMQTSEAAARRNVYEGLVRLRRTRRALGDLTSMHLHPSSLA